MDFKKIIILGIIIVGVIAGITFFYFFNETPQKEICKKILLNDIANKTMQESFTFDKNNQVISQDESFRNGLCKQFEKELIDELMISIVERIPKIVR